MKCKNHAYIVLARMFLPVENYPFDDFFRGHVVTAVQKFEFILPLGLHVGIGIALARHYRRLAVTYDGYVEMLHEILRYFIRCPDHDLIDVLKINLNILNLQ